MRNQIMLQTTIKEILLQSCDASLIAIENNGLIFMEGKIMSITKPFIMNMVSGNFSSTFIYKELKFLRLHLQ